ncbi:DUF4446 family protein [Alicyclobacillus mali (ex Roth et al. 2021)]|uniref:DUF4446 family protein n=2 Tax=Alicyclobacillus mali (ex Roth et al. 2021) TaxID=1123961 RepID=UPI000AC5CB2E|nr:DUF4446 family protein [Alicyclobacillus mali (ex Roth et al. 2021)]
MAMGLSILQPYTLDIAVCSAILAIICLVIAFVALSRSARLKRKFNRLKEITSTADLERVFEETKDAVRRLELKLREAEEHLREVEEALQSKVSTPAILRYNAFAEVGSDLSYSVALVDGKGDGVVITSIYGREDSVTYGKPVQGGDSSYMLTNEERTVIEEALRGAPQSGTTAQIS